MPPDPSSHPAAGDPGPRASIPAPGPGPGSARPWTGEGISLEEAACFPTDLHVPSGTFLFEPLSRGMLDGAPFLDNRMPASSRPPLQYPAHAIGPAAVPAGTVGWLFHTSFCCSTLLARALHVPPYQVSLKEPLVLRRLGDARFAGASVGALAAVTTRLLARPWDPDGAVLIKPTHAALNIAGELMASQPGSRAVVLTSSLEDFVVSNLKKTEETQRKIPQLVERAFRATRLHSRLPHAAFNPPDVLAAAALQWAAQREVCLDLVEAAGSDTVRVLDAAELLSDLSGVSARCAQWLRLPAPADAIAQRAAIVGTTNAKAVEVAYGPDRRAAEASMVKTHYGRSVEQALEWFDRWVRPAMRPEALRFTQSRLLEHSTEQHGLL